MVYNHKLENLDYKNSMIQITKATIAILLQLLSYAFYQLQKITSKKQILDLALKKGKTNNSNSTEINRDNFNWLSAMGFKKVL